MFAPHNVIPFVAVGAFMVGFYFFLERQYRKGAKLLARGICPHCGRRIEDLLDGTWCPECKENLLRWKHYVL